MARKGEKGKIDPAPNSTVKAVSGLEEILRKELELMYNCAVKIRKGYLQMLDSLCNLQLREIYQTQITHIDAEIQRLEKIFEVLQIEDTQIKCTATNILLQSIRSIKSANVPSVTTDIAIIIYTQKIESLGVAAYRAICELCETLGYYKIGEVLDNSLAEKENICRELTEILKKLNDEAMKEGTRGNEVLNREFSR
jgi:ferritin-like metal-binding protein YciE